MMITQPIFYLPQDIKVNTSESDCLDLILILLFGYLHMFSNLSDRQLHSEK